MSIHGLRIGLDGHLEELVLPADPADLATALNTALDSRVFDLVRFDGDLDLFVDDEGIYTSQPNPVMSIVARWLGCEQSLLFGPGVFLRGDPRTGDSLSLTTDQQRLIARTHESVLRTGRLAALLRGAP
ncbi:MAG: hypothetical protein J0G30_00150 [Actinomycetales bacterium]|nr:hypothetical protein [Actinomycetales bacterium]